MAKLQAKIDCAISHVGAAQVDANNLTQQQVCSHSSLSIFSLTFSKAKVATRAYEQLMEARVQEAKRFETACEWVYKSRKETNSKRKIY